MRIQGSKVLVTGASGGLGKAIVGELARRGAQLVITARSQQVLEELAAGTGAEVIVADLAERTDVDRLCGHLGDLDVLVANAGIGMDGPIEELGVDEIDRCIDVNLRAPVVMATRFAQIALERSRPAQIVMMGSLSGLAPTPNTRMYNATKFGLRGFTLALRQDLEGSGVGVTLVAPGFIRDAGLFADNDIELPVFVRTKSPRDVALAVVRAIERNPTEIYVAPTELRASATFANLAPVVSAAVQRALGTREMTGGG